MEVRYSLPEGAASIRVDRTEAGLAVTILRPDLAPVVYELEQWGMKQGRVLFETGGRRWTGHVAKDGQARLVATGGQVWRLEPPQPRLRQREAAGSSLTATMPGKVLDVLVRPGQEVSAGATLAILEAMKMELRVTAPSAGIVAAVFVQPGDVVDQGQRLVEFGSDAPSLHP